MWSFESKVSNFAYRMFLKNIQFGLEIRPRALNVTHDNSTL